jgi:hypothetical protein
VGTIGATAVVFAAVVAIGVAARHDGGSENGSRLLVFDAATGPGK